MAIGDGARWIWDYWDTYRPEAIQILDYWHAIEKIGVWVKQAIKEDSESKKWILELENLLYDDGIKEVIEQIESTNCKGSSSVEKLLTYLRNNQGRMLYKTFINKGLMIGSGPIESAHRQVIQKTL